MHGPEKEEEPETKSEDKKSEEKSQKDDDKKEDEPAMAEGEEAAEMWAPSVPYGWKTHSTSDYEI